MKKKILRRIRLDEISTVDSPAQAGAIVALIKNADGQVAEQSHATLSLEKRFVEMDSIHDAVEAMAQAIQLPGETIEKAMARLYRTQPEIFAAVDSELRALGSG